MAQHEAFDGDGQEEHHHGADDERQHVGQNHVVKAEPARNPFRKTRHGQRGDQHHRALREVEAARRREELSQSHAVPVLYVCKKGMNSMGPTAFSERLYGHMNIRT
ncbi:hypothetical protein G6F50_018310 [Rhizopus delemar]|uniref:Uncharacterized protein n=1 Tax=Rhizopus delemar TaxID=936053 RepID=A0A9P6XMV1_9FUNG|nr:hypothetical protein G6F50_018310 [Rhizopus delemar]